MSYIERHFVGERLVVQSYVYTEAMTPKSPVFLNPLGAAIIAPFITLEEGQVLMITYEDLGSNYLKEYNR